MLTDEQVKKEKLERERQEAIDNYMSQFDDSYDIELKESYTVYVGPTEVTDYLVTKKVAERIKEDWIEKGYDDCIIEEVTT